MEILGAFLLVSPRFQNTLAKKWMEHYDVILKKREIVSKPKMKGWGDVKMYLAMVGLYNIKLNDWLSNVDALANDNDWTSEMKCNLKRECNNLYKQSTLSLNTNIIDELNRKIERSDIITSFLSEDERVLRKTECFDFFFLKAQILPLNSNARISLFDSEKSKFKALNWFLFSNERSE